MTKIAVKAEFGDFQTPGPLAVDCCRYLANTQLQPASIVEPTCGKGSFLAAALQVFPQASAAFGFEINPAYVTECSRAVAGYPQCQVSVADFFQTDWTTILAELPEPILVVGNPPWVTNAALGSLGSSNLPEKSNFQGWKGFDAMTGKSNFDISEWMLLHFLDRLDGRDATLAMLCKTVVARKALLHAWKHGRQIAHAEIHRIDAAGQFNAAVDACLLCCYMQPNKRTTDCQIFDALNNASEQQTFGYQDERLIADIEAYSRWRHLLGESPYRWRSGVKHDCSKVMELTEASDGLRNGFGELVSIEDDYLFPMFKSSELANGRTDLPRRWMIITQTEIGQDTSIIKTTAPKTWQYLLDYSTYLDKRGSSIYRKRPRFSVFGVGGYAFTPWKIAISGFYKSLNFARIGPHQGKPVALDDTGYLLACESREEMDFLYDLLVSKPAQEFYSSLIFWDAKRPITTDLLATLSLDKLAVELNCHKLFERYSVENRWSSAVDEVQLSIF